MAECLMDSLLGKKFRIEDGKLLIASVMEGNSYVCCQLETDVLVLEKLSVEKAFELDFDKKITYEPTEPSPVFTESFVDEDYRRRQNFVREVMDAFNGRLTELSTGSHKPELRELESKYGFSKPGARKLLLRYFQGGCEPIALVDGRTLNSSRSVKPDGAKRGRKKADDKATRALTEQDKANMREAILSYYKKDHLSLKKTYMRMVFNHYRESPNSYVIADGCPTERQFEYFFNTTFSAEDKLKMKYGERDFLNNHRLLLGNAAMDANTVGSLGEIDSLEAAFGLVSSTDNQQYIGKCYMTAIVDVKTYAITAASVSFENNSFLAFSMCMENLIITDKAEMAKKWGFANFNPSLWPSNYIPQRLRCDRGSDFKSKGGARMCLELGIQTKDLEPGATGSLKGEIESLWHQFQEQYKPELVGKGLIRYVYGEDGKREACLTIEDATRLVIAFVLHYNNKPVRLDKINNKDLIDLNDDSYFTPAGMWKYYTDVLMNRPKPAFKERYDEYRFALMEPIVARTGEKSISITRKGIRYMGLQYSTEDEKLRNEMLGAPSPTNREWRRDLRDCSHLYYLEDGRLKYVTLNANKSDSSYIGMTWAEYQKYWGKAKEINRRMKNKTYENEMFMIDVGKAITGSTPSLYASTDGAREARLEQKYIDNYSKSVAIQIGIDGHSSKRTDNEIDAENTKQLENNNDNTELIDKETELESPREVDISSNEELSFSEIFAKGLDRYNSRNRRDN